MSRKARVPGTFVPPTAREELKAFFFPQGFGLRGCLKVLPYLLGVLVLMLGVFLVAFMSFGGWFFVLDGGGPSWLNWFLTVAFLLTIVAAAWWFRRVTKDPPQEPDAPSHPPE